MSEARRPSRRTSRPWESSNQFLRHRDLQPSRLLGPERTPTAASRWADTEPGSDRPRAAVTDAPGPGGRGPGCRQHRSGGLDGQQSIALGRRDDLVDPLGPRLERAARAATAASWRRRHAVGFDRARGPTVGTRTASSSGRRASIPAGKQQHRSSPSSRRARCAAGWAHRVRPMGVVDDRQDRRSRHDQLDEAEQRLVARSRSNSGRMHRQSRLRMPRPTTRAGIQRLQFAEPGRLDRRRRTPAARLWASSSATAKDLADGVHAQPSGCQPAEGTHPPGQFVTRLDLPMPPTPPSAVPPVRHRSPSATGPATRISPPRGRTGRPWLGCGAGPEPRVRRPGRRAGPPQLSLSDRVKSWAATCAAACSPAVDGGSMSDRCAASSSGRRFGQPAGQGDRAADVSAVPAPDELRRTSPGRTSGPRRTRQRSPSPSSNSASRWAGSCSALGVVQVELDPLRVRDVRLASSHGLARAALAAQTACAGFGPCVLDVRVRPQLAGDQGAGP